MVNDLCEYKKRRMENIKRNRARLAELGLEAPMREKAIKKRYVTARAAPKVRERRGSHSHIGKRVFVVWNEWEPYTGTVTKHDPFKSIPLCRVMSSTTMAKNSGKLQRTCSRLTHSLYWTKGACHSVHEGAWEERSSSVRAVVKRMRK